MVCLPSTTQATKFSEQRMFLLIFIAMIQQIFCLLPLLLMRLWCQFLPSWIPFEHSNFSLRLQPHSPITSDLRDLNFDDTVQWFQYLAVLWLLSMYYWLMVFWLSAVTFFPREPLNQLEISTLKECELKQFFCGLSRQALSLPSCVPLLCVCSFLHPLLPSACYAW